MPIIRGQFAVVRRRKFFAIICGEPGCGKTTIGESAPNPLLVDFDGGFERVSAYHRNGDYISNPKWEQYREDLRSPEIAQYETIVIDTGGAMVLSAKDWVLRTKRGAQTKSGDFNNLKGHGFVKTEVNDFINYCYNVLDKNVVIIFHTVEKADADGNPLVRISCEGATKDSVWTYADFGGYLRWIDGNRVLSFEPDSAFQAKRCYGIRKSYEIPQLSPGMKNTFLTDLFAEATANIASEAASLNAMREKYDNAINRVSEIISAITDGESATRAIGFMRDIEHSLTSREEASVMFKRKISELGLVYDAMGKRYVQKQKAEQANAQAEQPQNQKDKREEGENAGPGGANGAENAAKPKEATA